MNRRSRSARYARALAGAAIVVAVAGVSTAGAARPQALATSSPCGGTAQGAPWSYKGQKGTAYSVLGVNGAPCSTGLKFMAKWTRDRATFDLKPVPAGWHCSAIGDYSGLAKLGQCTTTKGGIFEWLPKQK